MNLTRTLPTLIAILLLAACAQRPVSVDVDVRAQMAETSGSAEVELESATDQDVDARFPTEAGQCVDLDDVGIDVTVQRAQIHWNVDVTYDGPPMTGMLQGRLYVAGAGDDLFRSQHTLGPTVTIKLDREASRFAGTAVLNPTQLRAANDGVVCWGVEVTGRDVSVEEGGTATLAYEINDLWMRLDLTVF